MLISDEARCNGKSERRKEKVRKEYSFSPNAIDEYSRRIKIRYQDGQSRRKDRSKATKQEGVDAKNNNSIVRYTRFCLVRCCRPPPSPPSPFSPLHKGEIRIKKARPV